MIRPVAIPRIRASLLFVAILSLTAVPLQEAYAQAGMLRSQEQPIRVSLMPVYQQYSDGDQSVSEMSSQLALAVPVSQRVNIRARANYASMGGDGLERVHGLNDVRGTVTYARSIGDGSLVFNLNTNIPVGKRELTPGQLQTTGLISTNYYDFQVSSFGRGFSLAPSVTGAIPITDRLVAGLGGSYQHQRGYRPSQGMELYVPGDAIEVKGGLDYQLSRSALLGMDLSFRRYNTDRVGGLDRFQSGNKLVGRLRYLFRKGFTTLRVLARYANWEESQLLPLLQTEDGSFTTGEPVNRRVIPSHGMGAVSYQTRFDSGLRVSVRVSGHRYSETDAFEAKRYGAIRIRPSVEIGDLFGVAPHVKFTAGSFTGIEGGIRLQVRY